MAGDVHGDTCLISDEEQTCLAGRFYRQSPVLGVSSIGRLKNRKYGRLSHDSEPSQALAGRVTVNSSSSPPR